MKRVLTAAVLIPVVAGAIFWIPTARLRWVLALVALLCLREFLQLASHYHMEAMPLSAYLAGAWAVGSTRPPGALFLLGVTLLLLTWSLRSARDLAQSLPGVAATLLGIVYITLPFRAAGDLHAASPHWLFYILLINWAGDAAAYYAGRALGRRKLAPRVSPGKTWEGAAASLLVSVPAGVFYLRYFLPRPPPLLLLIALTAAANIAAQVGDLAESALKRGASVKDSGGLLPGHGGFLDRLDGFLFSAPLVRLALYFAPLAF